MKATVVLYTSKRLANGEFPVMVRITDRANKKYMPVGMSLPATDTNPDRELKRGCKRIYKSKYWNFKKNELFVKRGKDDNPEVEKYLDRKDLIAKIYNPYSKAIDKATRQGRTMTIDQLIKSVKNPVNKNLTFFGYFEKRIDELKQEGNAGNRAAYKNTLHKFKLFHPTDIYFSDLTTEILLDFRKHMEKEDLKGTTISVHLRTIRAVYNSAIIKGYANAAEYPFKKGNELFKELTTTTKSRAITKDEIESIKFLNVDESLIKAKYYFLFSYYLGGITFQDIARLKWTNIISNRIEFTRYKLRKKDPLFISIGINDNVQKILNYFQANNEGKGFDPDNYIFPVLDTRLHIKPQQQTDRINRVRKLINAKLKKIGEAAGIETKLTTYVARHTFASEVKNTLGGNTLKSMQMMGHKKFESHQAYLKNFDHEEIDKIANGL